MKTKFKTFSSVRAWKFLLFLSKFKIKIGGFLTLSMIIELGHTQLAILWPNPISSYFLLPIFLRKVRQLSYFNT